MCAIASRSSPLCTYGGRTINPAQPAFAAYCANKHAPCVEAAPMAAMTGARPSSAAEILRHNSTFSSVVSDCPSPSEPPMTMPSQPSSIIQTAWRTTAEKSTSSDAVSCVVIAGMTPDHLNDCALVVIALESPQRKGQKRRSAIRFQL